MEQMTVSRALQELKLLDARIEKQIGNANFVDAYQAKAKKLIRQPISRDDFEKNARAEYDSINALIKRRNSIKKSILVSNATTTVKVGGVPFLVIEAIERKRAIELEKQLLAKLRLQYANIMDFVSKSDAELKENLLKMLQQSVSDDRIRDKGDYEKLAAPFKEDNQLVIVDPLKIKDKADQLDEQIDTFLSNVDYALSESNATTMIQV